MKKTLVTIFTALAMNLGAQNSDYELPPIPQVYQGVYISEEFIKAFSATANYSQSRKELKQPAHEYLLVAGNKITSGIHDGYAINKSDYSRFRLNQESGLPVITDNQGIRYRKISQSTHWDEGLHTWILEKFAAKVNENKPLINLVFNGSTLKLNLGGHLSGPYKPMLNSYVFSQITMDIPTASKYNLIIEADNQMLGLILSADQVQVDRISRYDELKGNVFQGPGRYFSNPILRLIKE